MAFLAKLALEYFITPIIFPDLKALGMGVSVGGLMAMVSSRFALSWTDYLIPFATSVFV